MFTSRAEFRLLLRGDNADLRLTPAAVELGLLPPALGERVAARQHRVAEALSRLTATFHANTSLLSWLRRPEVDVNSLPRRELLDDLALDPNDLAELEAQAKYGGYIARQLEQVARQEREEGRAVPAGFDYGNVKGLRREASERLAKRRPTTVGEMTRIPGVTPADVALLLVHFRR
jgi:tRNA uridine 5-carboxymethylaminomethyl modification enzyme